MLTLWSCAAQLQLQVEATTGPAWTIRLAGFRGSHKFDKKGGATLLVLSREPGAKSIMFSHHIGLAIYLAIGLFGFISIGGLGAERAGGKKTPIWRKLMAIVFWPLAMIGAIEG
jgi:hypothetical protein